MTGSAMPAAVIPAGVVPAVVIPVGVVTAGLAGGALLVWRLRRRYLIVTVLGPSMLPAYADGDRVLVQCRPGRPLRRGDVVVADLPHRLEPAVPLASGAGGVRAVPAGPPETSERVVKRVAAIPGDPVPPGVAASGPEVPAGCLVLLGDNLAESADSRQYGCVPADRVIGVVLRHLR